MEIPKNLTEEATNRLNNFKELKDKKGDLLKNQDDVVRAHGELEESITIQSGVLTMTEEIYDLFCDAIRKVREA